MVTTDISDSLEEVLTKAAENFAVLSAPMRLRILSNLCHGEKTVSELLDATHASQPNMSQHLTILFKAGFITKRRSGNRIYYAIVDDRIVRICQLMCEKS